MTTSAMCDYCGEHENPRRMFSLIVPHSNDTLHFCNKNCLIEYINKEY